MKTRIKELRLEKNLTQQALAEQLGISQAVLSKLECELSVPDASLLVNLSRLFHVSTDYILFLSEERSNADHLLTDNMHHLKKYQHLLSIYQKMNQRQQDACYNFLCSMLDVGEDDP
jgi:transcriptional regulator with XRE-family HTH domain